MIGHDITVFQNLFLSNFLQENKFIVFSGFWKKDFIILIFGNNLDAYFGELLQKAKL